MQVDGIKRKIDANHIDDLDTEAIPRACNVNVAGPHRQTEASGMVDDFSYQDARILASFHGTVQVALELQVLQIRRRQRGGDGHQR